MAPGTIDVEFPTPDGAGVVRGIVHAPALGEPRGAIIITHGRSNDMKNPFVRRVAEAVSGADLLALRMNFRYVDAKHSASRDLSAEEEDVHGAVRFARTAVPAAPIFVAGKSMGARVCARASSDQDVAGIISLGYPLHPMFRPEVKNPPEWPKIVKPALFVQGDHDPFCDLARMREELPRLTQPHELVVITNAGHSFEPKGGKRDTFLEVREAVLRWIARQLGDG